jgi:hypothetical protein
MTTRLLDRIPLRRRKYLIWGAGACLIYSLVGFFLVPPILKWQMTKRLPQITKRQVIVRQVKANPWTLSLAVRGLELKEDDGRPFASWDELFVNFQASSLFRWAWTFKEIRVVKPFGEVILFKDGRLNFANMLDAPSDAPPKPEGPASIPRVNIFYLEVTNAFVALEDRTRRSLFRTEYRPINLHLREFTTRPESDTPYSFRAESDAGRSVTWAGDFSVHPLRSAGHLELTAVQLPRFRPYLEEFTHAVPTNGLADLQLDYRFAADTNGLQFVVTNAALQVAEFDALDPDTGETVVSLKGLDVSQASFNLRESAARLGAVKVSQAMLLSRLKRDGRLNLLDLIAVPAKSTNESSKVSTDGSQPPLTVSVDEFVIEQTAVSFEDLTRRTPFRTELKPIEVSVKGFTTGPNVDASYSFHVTSEAAEAFEGAGSFSVNPLRSTGEVKISAVDVKKYLPYVEDFFRGKIIAGRIDVRAPYQAALDAQVLQASVTNLDLKLSALEVLMPETDEQVTHIKGIAFERVDASLEDRRGRVGLFQGDGGSLLLRRQKDGKINLLGLLAASETNTTAVVGARPGAIEPGTTNASAIALGGWTLNVDEIQLDNYVLKIEDEAPAKPAVFLIDQLSANLKGASTIANSPVTANLSFRFNQSGAVALRGTAQREPLLADFDVAVTNLDLRAAQPYLELFAAADIVRGGLTTTGKLHFQTNDASAPLLTFAGDVRLAEFAAADQGTQKEFLRWDDLRVSGIEAAVSPHRLKVDEIQLTRPVASLLIGPDRQPNVLSILPRERSVTNSPAASPGTSTPGTQSVPELIPIQLGSLTLDQASLIFGDESVQPNVTFGIEEISGTVKGLSSQQNTPAEIDLAGTLGAQSPFSIRGRANPFPPALMVDLTITNGNTQLTPLSGYMETYGGYPLRRGRLSTQLRYQVSDAQLEAANKIQVDGLTLGPHNDNANATKLPLKLGIALLKDSNDRIELDVPVSGRIDDPEFSIAPTVLKVVGNVIVKAAASPFNLLGALVGGGGDELSFVEFTPGSTNLVKGELDKLGKLASALAKRPALSLEIEGAVDPNGDRDALARQSLAEQLKAKRLQELTAKGRAPESVATFQIEPEERERLLRGAFVERFGTNIAEVIQANLAHLTATNQPASAATKSPRRPKRSLLQRVTGIFGDSGGSTRKAEKRLPKADREALGLATPELMEDLLAGQIPVTDEEFRQLMSARARWVQDWLVESGQIPADRLFLIVPKNADANYRGASRVNLSLN